MSKRYGTPVELLAKKLDSDCDTSDPSYDLIYALAMAHRAAERLSEVGVDLLLNGRPLLFDHIEAAYREALFIRSKRTPKELLDVSKVSKLGRING